MLVTGDHDCSTSCLENNSQSQLQCSPENEDGIVYFIEHIAQQLHWMLQRLPEWAIEKDGCGEAFLSGICGYILSTRDDCRLIAVTHSFLARQMQKVAAQLVGCLAKIAGESNCELMSQSETVGMPQ